MASALLHADHLEGAAVDHGQQVRSARLQRAASSASPTGIDHVEGPKPLTSIVVAPVFSAPS
jgi:hypothetical protein